MPELPEVELYRQLGERALRRRIRSVDAPDDWFLKRGATAQSLAAAAVGEELLVARRIGKLLLFDVSGGAVISVHFGMAGKLFIDGQTSIDDLIYASNAHRPEWDRFGLHFADGGSLVVHDSRRLGAVELDPDEGRLGPDAASIGVAGLRDALGRSVIALKARLMDQSRLAGVGNLIADEVLWRASLDPTRQAGSLSGADVRRLHRQLRQTIADLSSRGGSHTGELQPERVRGGHCPRDGTELRRETVGGRTTYWCPTHQR